MYQTVNITFKEAFTSWRHKLFCFKGRARRAEYWYPYIIFYIFTLIGNALLNSGAIKSVGVLMTFFAVEFVCILLFLPVAVRRLHDIGLSGLWSMLGYLPLAACIPLLINPQRFFQYIVMQIAFPGDNTLFWTICIALSMMNVAFIILLLIDGKKEQNKYGDSPKYIFVADDADESI